MRYRIKRLAPGVAGWVGIGAVVVAAELLDKRTMSAAFRAGRARPVIGPAITMSYVLVTAHLFGLIPGRWDPLHQFASHSFAKGRDGLQ